jgi:hypothetical protein
MKPKSYKAGYLSILVKSCYDSDFYHRIKEVSLFRSILFLFFFSLLIAATALVTLAIFWSRLFPTQEAFVADFKEQVPEVQMSFDGETLSSDPSDITLFLGFDESSRLRIMKDRPFRQALRIQVSSERTLEEALQDPPDALGVYAYGNGLLANTGFQNQSFPYDDFEFDRQLDFDKTLLTLFIESGFPIAQEWLKSLLLTTGPLLIFFYHFVGAWILAILFSLLGMAALLLMQKRFYYSFLIKLSFFSSVPALVVALLTSFMGISVPFIPLLVYLSFYGYGLWVYEK